jgi:hypothetical protein
MTDAIKDLIDAKKKSSILTADIHGFSSAAPTQEQDDEEIVEDDESDSGHSSMSAFHGSDEQALG